MRQVARILTLLTVMMLGIGSMANAQVSIGIQIGPPPAPRVVRVAPHHDGRAFLAGYWEGSRGRIEHDHRFDHDRYRDDRADDHDHDRGRRR